MRITPFLLTGALATATPFSLFTRQTPSTDPNADCGLQPFGYGPPSANAASFSANPVYQAISLIAPTPKNYTAAFRDATGSTSQPGYQGYYLLQTYNTTQCAGYCNTLAGCQAFNLYSERDPLQKPAGACPNPPPTTNIKCALWSQPVGLATATNDGQYQDQFQVVIAGSDGFNVV